MGNWLRGNGKHSENSGKKLKIPLKNCKTGRQGRENAHKAAQQKSPTDLKWLDISIKRTWKIGHTTKTRACDILYVTGSCLYVTKKISIKMFWCKLFCEIEEAESYKEQKITD